MMMTDSLLYRMIEFPIRRPALLCFRDLRFLRLVVQQAPHTTPNTLSLNHIRHEPLNSEHSGACDPTSSGSILCNEVLARDMTSADLTMTSLAARHFTHLRHVSDYRTKTNHTFH